MRKTLFVGMLAAIQLLVPSCASVSQSAVAFHEELPAHDGDVIVYVYRMPSMVGGAVAWVVRLDGKEVGVLRQNAYIALHTTAGAHTIMVGDSPSGFGGDIIDAVARDKGTEFTPANTSHYLRCAGFKFGFVSREVAMKELPGMKYDDGRPLPR